MSTASSQEDNSSISKSTTGKREANVLTLRQENAQLKDPVDSWSSHNVLLLLIAFRILNSFCVRTFFQPDEYFQSLEPAWQIAFGKDSGAWITWEWRHHLRSSIHPYIFAAVYSSADSLTSLTQLDHVTRAELLVIAPKVIQAVIAAVGDYYTWKLGESRYGKHSVQARACLILSVASAWQWFCSTRTLSNCLETSLTVTALYLWSTSWNQDGMGTIDPLQLAKSLIIAAVACILRPTNVLIWGVVAFLAVVTSFARQKPGSVLKLSLLAVLCGSAVLAISAFLDRAYYEEWTFPPLKFLHFNLTKGLAVFYGKNRWDYYFTEGIPLLLTGYLPFFPTSLVDSKNLSHKPAEGVHGHRVFLEACLGVTAMAVPVALSFISHKEVRFIYPLLPIFHVMIARDINTFITWSKLRWVPYAILAINVAIATFATQFHQPGPISVMSFLRQEYATHYLAPSQSTANSIAEEAQTMTVSFLTPCHSTPWRSHLVYPGIQAWALSCEPPIEVPISERERYRDEADQFYDSPEQWLLQNLGKPNSTKSLEKPPGTAEGLGRDGKEGEKSWTDYVVFFEEKEELLRKVMTGEHEGSKGEYVECWRGWNSFFHDDWRRQGDLIVWCRR